MKLRNVFLIVFLIHFVSCKNVEKENIKSYKVKLSQEVNDFVIDDNKDTLYVVNVVKSINSYDRLSLVRKNKDSVIDYKYSSTKEYKNLNLRYHIEKDVLVSDNTFFYKNKAFQFQNLSFKFYGLSKGKDYVTHPKLLFFNKDYGILANVTHGANFLFLKDSISDLEKEKLFKRIINKIEE